MPTKRSSSTPFNNSIWISQCGFIVEHWDEKSIYGSINNEGRVIYQLHHAAHPIFSDLHTILFPKAPLTLLGVTRKGYDLVAEVIVLIPDYLIDISSLAATLRPYGDHPLNYLLRRLSPSIDSPHILLGNTINAFMDDCINEAHILTEKELFDQSMHHCFSQWPLSYTYCVPPLTQSFFEEAHRQFHHIYKTVRSTDPPLPTDEKEVCIRSDRFLLEPSFICKALGLRGRMDLIDVDYHTVIEVKSGKANQQQGRLVPHPEHLLQVLLYREVLHYNLGLAREDIKPYLFYTKYPMMLSTKESTTLLVQRAIACRNRIVQLEYQLGRGDTNPFYADLSWEKINVRKLTGRFAEQYLRPPVMHMIHTLQHTDALTRKYFDAFLCFILREQYYAKVGNAQSNDGRGFANVWNHSQEEKALTGDCIPGLLLTEIQADETGIQRLVLTLPNNSLFVPNFRVGEWIQLYHTTNVDDNACNQPITRGFIEELSSTQITLCLLFTQRNRTAFPKVGKYVIEHEYSDSPFTQMLRALYSLLTSSADRRDLLLHQRMPRYDHQVQLAAPLEDERLAQVVLHAKQACDYYTLVGPPGTGKTSRYLQAMVDDFLKDSKLANQNILLLAYTNRAVDEICESLIHSALHPHFIRLGQKQSCAPAYQSYHITELLAKATTRAAVQQHVEQCRVWVSTVSHLCSNTDIVRAKFFHTCIIDEASQILEPQILGLFTAMHQTAEQTSSKHPFIGKFILIGDHKQLPAVVVQSEAESAITDPSLCAIGLNNLRNSLFQRLHTLSISPSVGALSPQPHLTDTLTQQGRMHRDICQLASGLFYNNQLHPLSLPRQHASLSYSPGEDRLQTWIASTRIGFIDVHTPHQATNNKHNIYEAKVVSAIVSELIILHQQQGNTLDPVTQIGIIVPFRNQITMIRQQLALLSIPHLTDITIDTVECYQGSQRDFIIYSTTISEQYQLDILSSPQQFSDCLVDRKLNVAITRAREQLFIVGNGALLSTNTLYNRLLKQCPTYVWPQTTNG